MPGNKADSSGPLRRETDLGGLLTPFAGNWPVLHEDTFAFHGSQIVGNVTIGKGSSVWHNCVLRGDVNDITIGEYTNIQDGTVIHVSTRTYPTRIDDHVLVGHMAMLHGCHLKNYSFVGIGAIVMDNCTIEEDGMLAAGAMLTPGKTIGRGELWAGRPAKFLRMVSEKELSRNRQMGMHYYKLAQQHKKDSLGIEVEKPYP
ncbi:gamma carbonic anhydrase family protein [Kordiimonas sediminis]|uniref:Gamma carbonic anhydrase family protein n=1 Tax=Kordiimonas sediminis TaxID=1735581 RepID=A0A919AWB3_9PROT|nr:gamma carbonic anhydrase family protein [Kordiimonas sediminis]GHF27880.1 gamma carbonic anhydrase family protein [Kordiimonas sediminis]